MKRPKVTEEAFTSRKFQDQNLSRIQEAVRDASLALGLAAVCEFKNSEHFPSEEELKESDNVHGDHNQLMLTTFKSWIQSCSQKDQSFAFSIQMVTLFGLQSTVEVMRNGLGTMREAIWKILLPVFAQLQFKNYWTEALY